MVNSGSETEQSSVSLKLSGSPFFWSWFLNLSVATSRGNVDIPVPLSCYTRWFPPVQMHSFSPSNPSSPSKTSTLVEKLNSEKSGKELLQDSIRNLVTDSDSQNSSMLWVYALLDSNGAVFNEILNSTHDYTNALATNSDGDLKVLLPPGFTSPAFPADGCIGPRVLGGPPRLSYGVLYSPRGVEELDEFIVSKCGGNSGPNLQKTITKSTETTKSDTNSNRLKLSTFSLWSYKTAHFFGLSQDDVRRGFELQRRALERMKTKESFEERMFPGMRVKPISGESAVETGADSVMDIDLRLWGSTN